MFKGQDQPVSGSWWLWGNFPGEQTDGTLEGDWVTPRRDQQGITDQLLYKPASRNASTANNPKRSIRRNGE